MMEIADENHAPWHRGNTRCQLESLEKLVPALII
jgi:hypothetical protein